MPRYTKKPPKRQELVAAGHVGEVPYTVLHTKSGWYTQGLVKDTTYLVGFSREDRRGAIMDLVAQLQKHKWTGTLKLVAAG
jgi:hypothetical protein